MATVTVFTAEKMQEIQDATIVDALVVDGHLILIRFDDAEIDAGLINPVPAPSVGGSRGGNAALASLLTVLDTAGYITDDTVV